MKAYLECNCDPEEGHNPWCPVPDAEAKHNEVMLAAMKLAPQESAGIMRSIWGKAFAANIEGWSVTSRGSEPMRRAQYKFLDGSSITWESGLKD